MKLSVYSIVICCLFFLTNITCGQENKSDSISVESEIKLSPYVFDKLQSKPLLLRRIIEIEGDELKLKSNEFKAQSKFLKEHTVQFQFRIPEGLSPDPIEIYPKHSEDYENLDYLKPIRPYDSRFEISQLKLSSKQHQSVILNSFGVLGIVSSNQLQKSSAGYTLNKLATMQQLYDVCSDEPFKNQPVLCFGTAFLISHDIVLTARHNLDFVSLKDMRLLIGYKIHAESGLPNKIFKPTDVYSATKIIGSNELDKLDLVLVKLNKTVESASPILIEKTFDATSGEKIYTLGYPIGLPLKYTTNASVIKKENDFVYYTTLDTFKGNSGSPVFSQTTHNAVGVLVEGGVDFKFNGSCYTANLCGESNCIGEKVVNISKLGDHIRELINENQK